VQHFHLKNSPYQSSWQRPQMGSIVNKTAQNANDAINKLLTPLKHWVKTLTFDNGREFSWHEKLAENLDCYPLIWQ
jgi:IS30 family transposase